MKTVLSNTWKRSIQPRKQRKYLYNVPLHIKRKLVLTSSLSKDLRTKHNRRSLGLKKGDTVKIMRGQFKGKRVKVDKINIITGKIYLESIEHVKKDGTKAFYPMKASNLMIVEINIDDKMRKKILERKVADKNEVSKKVVVDKNEVSKKVADKKEAGKKEIKNG